MNAKLLFAATVAVALASSLAVAGEAAAPSRADVVADYHRAALDGTLRKNDYDFDRQDFVAAPVRSRADVVAEIATARNASKLLPGPLRNRTYNPSGTDLLGTSTLARAQVKSDVVAAVRAGTLRHSDYDDVPVPVSRRAARYRAPATIVAGTNTAQSGSR